jgi:hypothetical protein
MTVALGLGSKVYRGPGKLWVTGYAGDIFYEMAWILLVVVLKPGVSVTQVTLWVFGITAAVETLQLWQPEWLQALRATLVGQLFLGSTFSPADFLYYGIGCGLTWWGLVQLGKR